ncbi:hypothetical protein ANCCAN_01326 [Ancylostoma caninum]|uniref:Uncharacterized protein n=1 Tax=Ancylostoma caninum TaxID=29170 RepID=A0A368HBC1_ANCCA|nr:hypothetical protein ANCCAN_01326 [Ancylostoma caninum]
MGTTWYIVVFAIACTLGTDAHYDHGYGDEMNYSASEQRRLIYLPKPHNFIMNSLLKYPRSNVRYPIYLAKQTNNYGQETGTVLGLLLPVQSLGETYQKVQTSQSSYNTTQSSYNRKSCTLPSGAASLFLEASEQLVEDYTDGARTPLPSREFSFSYVVSSKRYSFSWLLDSCPLCARGSQLSYAPVNPRNDISEMRSGVITNFVPGDESCTLFLTLDPSEAVKEYQGGKLERGTDQLSDRERVIYYNGNEYNYIEMNAITCGGCRTDANTCYSTNM